MATYVNNLRLKEIATGDESGTWGTTTNTNLELLGESFAFGTEAITTNADTHTTTIADGSSDPGRSAILKYTGTLDSTCTITIAPNTVKRVQFIHNGTSGSQSIVISQGSGANVTIPSGYTKLVHLDGAGSGAAVIDALVSGLGIGGLSYPIADGSSGQFITTNGSGVLSFATVTGTTINNNADNRIITGSGSANTLEGEATLTYDGTNLDMGDAKVLRFGASQDLQIQHTGSYSSIIDSGTGSLLLGGNNVTIANTALNENMIICVANGAVTLYHDNSAKLATASTGIIVTGDILPDGDDTRDLGSASKQWRDIYTGDLNLNNTKTRDNEVDGTRGSWTIQEGAEDLFIMNRISGKKYKFKLEEMI
tara:strand:- start:1410 stop:2510 length:1101 start_codon:yes stop_codon:yes gene_type:complete